MIIYSYNINQGWTTTIEKFEFLSGYINSENIVVRDVWIEINTEEEKGDYLQILI